MVQDPTRRTDDWPVRALATARPQVFWLDDPDRPQRRPPLTEAETADLAVVGGGYTGLWAALRAKERSPDRDVVLLEGGGCGDQASGRNGGFASASLTHGFGNGMERWPEELPALACSPAPARVGCAAVGWRWPPTRSRRCCVGCA